MSLSKLPAVMEPQRISSMSLIEQFSRFAVAGALATVMQYAILIALVEASLADPVAASGLGFAISALANYALNRSFTFRSRQAHADALPKFVLVAVVGLVLNTGLVWLFHVPVGLHYLLAQVVATCGTLVWNFGVNRTWTFAARSLPHDRPKETS